MWTSNKENLANSEVDNSTECKPETLSSVHEENSLDKDEYFMELALAAAANAYTESEIPIGCVLVKSGQVIATAYNKREQNQNTLAHAELLAINSACKLFNSWRLDNVDCYVTLEPCHMCLSALQQARVHRIIYGAASPKTGAIESIDNFFSNNNLNHYPEIKSGILAEEATNLLQQFFNKRRDENKFLDKSLGGRSNRVKLRTDSLSDSPEKRQKL